MKYYYPNLQLDPQNISSTETGANSADTKIIDVNMTKEQEKVTKETSKDLKRLISVVAESLQKDIEEKLKDDPVRAEQLIKKVEKVTKIGLGMQISSSINSLGNVFGFIKKINPNYKEPDFFAKAKESLSPIADKVNGIEDKVSDISSNFGSQIMSGGLDMSAEQNNVSQDALGASIDKLEADAKALKKKEGITIAGYRMAVLKLLQQVATEVKNTIPGQAIVKNSTGTIENSTITPTTIENKNTQEQIVEDFIAKAEKYKGYEYDRGGNGENGKIDCSGLIYAAWKDMGITGDANFPRPTAEYLYKNQVDQITDLKSVKRGDLLFHKAKSGSSLYKAGDIQHVMIALSGVKNDGKGDYIEMLDSREKDKSNAGVNPNNPDVAVRKQYLNESGIELLAGTPKKSYEAMINKKGLNPTNLVKEEDDGNEFSDVQVRADDNLDDLKYTKENDMITVEKMKSLPFARSESGTTLCSQTARLNLENFGLSGVPQANAFDARDMYGNTYKVGQKVGSGEIVEIKDTFSQDIKGNYFDIYTGSKSKYGHRLVGFRSEPSNQVYVMDPYNIKKDGYSSRTPIKIEEYIKDICDAKNRPILKIVGYETKKKVVDSEQIIAKATNDKSKVISMNTQQKMAA